MPNYPIPLIIQKKLFSFYSFDFIFYAFFVNTEFSFNWYISNPIILNPGPDSKDFHQNVQGLISISELDKPQPKLNEENIRELLYISRHS